MAVGIFSKNQWRINGLGLLFFKNNPVCFSRPADNILLLLADEQV